MPRLFTQRERYSHLFSNKPTAYPRFNWELINAILYIVGGFTFIIGSIFFLPTYESLSDIGAWIFFWGSLVYLVVTGSDLWEATTYLRYRKMRTMWNWLEFIIANIYVGGTILFTIGSLLFLSEIDKIVAGGWCFTIGSLLFLLGACFNVIQIIHEPSFIELQLLNATAITFALGSMLFLIASLPYLSDTLTIQKNGILFRYVGWEYIFGSILFLTGGIFHYYRSPKKDYKKENSQNRNVILKWETTFHKLKHQSTEKTAKEQRAKQLKLQVQMYNKISKNRKEANKNYYLSS
ncbi:MAG: YrhK family protein [Halothece sp.]